VTTGALTYRVEPAGVHHLLERAHAALKHDGVAVAPGRLGPADHAAVLALALAELGHTPGLRPDIARLAIPLLARNAREQKVLRQHLVGALAEGIASAVFPIRVVAEQAPSEGAAPSHVGVRDDIPADGPTGLPDQSVEPVSQVPERNRLAKLVEFLLALFKEAVDLFRRRRERLVRDLVSELAAGASIVLPRGGGAGQAEARPPGGLVDRETTGVRRLHVEKTLNATLAAGGFVEPRWREQTRVVDYVFLIHRRSSGDLDYFRIEQVLALLKAVGVPLSFYDYSHDPRSVVDRLAAADLFYKSLDLDQLFDRHPGSRLVVVSDGHDLVHPFTLAPSRWLGLLSRWPKRALLTPTPRNLWGKLERALHADAGFRVGSSRRGGILGISALFKPEEPVLAGDAPYVFALSSQLLLDDPAVAGDPSPVDADRIERDLRRYLGVRGYEWLAACAYYPELRPELAWALEGTLDKAGCPPGMVSGDELRARLASLPWFRRGYLPVWLRQRVIQSLPSARRREIRRIVVALFEAAVPAGASAAVSADAATSGDRPTALPIRLFERGSGGMAVDAVTIALLADGPLAEISIALSRALSRALSAAARRASTGASEPAPQPQVQAPHTSQAGTLAEAMPEPKPPESGIAARLLARYGSDYPGFATVDQVDKIIAEHTRQFFGRDDQLTILDAFVADNPRGILVLAAPAGLGKTALLANWGRQRQAIGAAVAYHFFSATAARTVQRADALRSLLLQVSLLRGRSAPTLPDDPARLEDLLTQELCQDAIPGRPLIIILDGLDEAAEWLPPLAPAGLGRHVYIVVSGRANHNERPEYLATWLLDGGRAGYPVMRHDMPGLSSESVLAWVRTLVPGLGGDQETRLAQRLAATSEGLPLFLQFILDDLRDRRARGEELADIFGSLDQLPAPFLAYAEQQVLAMSQGLRQEPGNAVPLRVFALLTLLKGSLPLAELQEILDTRASPWDFDPRITRWFAPRSTGVSPAIAFLHPRLADVFRGALQEAESTAALFSDVRDRLLAYCQSSWANGSLYALTNLPLHLIEAGQVDDAFAVLTDFAFIEARLSHAAAPALITRTMQDLAAAEDAAPSDLRPEVHARRSSWAAIEHELLGVVQGPDPGRARQVLRRLQRQRAESQPSPLLRELRGHRGAITGATALNDGRLLSWSDDGTLRLWAADGAELAELRSGRLTGAIVLSDGRLLTWGSDGTLQLWAADTGVVLAELRGHRDAIWGARALHDGRLLSWSQDATLRLWMADGTALPTLRGHRSAVFGATELSDGRLLSWSFDSTLRLWSGDGAVLAVLSGHTEGLHDATVLADGRLLSWSLDRTLRLWAADGAALAVLSGHTDAIEGASALADGRLLSWSRDGVLRIWAADGAALAELKGHSTAVIGAAALADGRLLSWGEDGTLRLWAVDGAALATLSAHRRGVNGATALNDGRLLSWGGDGTLRLWTPDGTPLAELTGHDGAVTGATVLPDGRLLSWGVDGTLRLWTTDPESPSSRRDGRDTIDVFLSYSRKDAAIARSLAAELSTAGFRVWYDMDISGGERFAEHISASLDAAKVVVVLWSEESVRSDWVLFEASRAHQQGKLVPIRLPSLDPQQVPLPFNALDTRIYASPDGLPNLMRDLRGLTGTRRVRK
jgi:WD40 repeat protein